MVPLVGQTLAVMDIGVWDALRDILLLLLVAVLLGTIAERLHQSVIVGYLIAGTLVGPNVLDWTSKQQEIYYIAELGVALLLFVIGLEFSPRQLLQLGKMPLGTGVTQILATVAIVWGIARTLGLSDAESLVLGMMIAMSSTACVLRLLKDRAELDGVHGRAALGVLLVQDVAVVPMMLAVGAMAGQQSLGHVAVKLSVSVLLAVGLVALFYVLFTYIVPRFFQQRTWQLNRDLPILLAMVLALGCAWLANQVRLSPALGAFAGGVLLAASPFATQIRADVRPLNTVLVTLFFAAIGMFGDPVWLIKNWALVGGIVLLIVVGKPLVVALLARIFGAPWRYAIATGLCLAQIGEFSFVLATIAQRETDGVAIMSATTFRALVSATIISLLLTPYMVGSATRIGAWWDRLIRRAFSGSASADQTSVVVETAEGMAKRDILIIGFGPAGQRVAEGLMTDYQNRMVVIDLNRDNVDVAQRYGLEGVLGDASQTEILEHAGIYEAEVVVLTLPDHRIMRQLIYHVRDLAPGARIVARCRYHVRHWELLTAGADHVADEEDEVGRVMASQVGELLGHVPSEA